MQSQILIQEICNTAALMGIGLFAPRSSYCAILGQLPPWGRRRRQRSGANESIYRLDLAVRQRNFQYVFLEEYRIHPFPEQPGLPCLATHFLQ